MYLPKSFAEQDLTALDRLIARDNFVSLVTVRDGSPVINHLPVLYARNGDAIELRGHWARPNPQSGHAGPATAVDENRSGLPDTLLAFTTARIVCTPATLSKVQPPSVATPLAFVVWAALVSVPPPFSFTKLTVTPLTALPPASVTFTLGMLVSAVPMVAEVVKVPFCATFAAAPAWIPIAFDVIDVMPLLANVSVQLVDAVPESTSPSKYAEPPSSVVVLVVPESVPQLEVTVTVFPNCATALLFASRNCTTGLGDSALPLMVVDGGCVVIARCVAAPAVSRIELDVGDDMKTASSTLA